MGRWETLLIIRENFWRALVWFVVVSLIVCSIRVLNVRFSQIGQLFASGRKLWSILKLYTVRKTCKSLVQMYVVMPFCTVVQWWTECLGAWWQSPKRSIRKNVVLKIFLLLVEKFELLRGNYGAHFFCEKYWFEPF